MGVGCGSMVENLPCVGESSILIGAKIKQNQKCAEWGWIVLLCCTLWSWLPSNILFNYFVENFQDIHFRSQVSPVSWLIQKK